MKFWPFVKPNDADSRLKWEHRIVRETPSFKNEAQRTSYFAGADPDIGRALDPDSGMISVNTSIGKGKISDGGYDLFDSCCVRVPALSDFVFEATLSVDSFPFGESRTNQEGFGLFARDTLECDSMTGYPYSNMIFAGGYYGGWNVFCRTGVAPDSIENIKNHCLFGKDRYTGDDLIDEGKKYLIDIRMEKKGQMVYVSLKDALTKTDLLTGGTTGWRKGIFAYTSGNEVAARIPPEMFSAREKDSLYLGIMAAGCSVSTDLGKISLILSENGGNAEGTDIYAAPDGSFFGAGTEGDPVDIQTAVDMATEKNTVVLAPGRYLLSEDLIARKGDGAVENRKILCREKHAAVLDFQGVEHGFFIEGDHWDISGITVTRGMGFQISGSYNHLNGCLAEKNMETGFLIRHDDINSPVEKWPSHNTVENCVSRHNIDRSEHNADGFACKIAAGEGNRFIRCLAYLNTDDGFDLFSKNKRTGAVNIAECRSCLNGYKLSDDGKITETEGNGNGYKLGGSGLSVDHVVTGSEAYGNRGNGFTSNSNPSMTLRDCISGNNLLRNYEYYFKGRDSVPKKNIENCAERDDADFDKYRLLSDIEGEDF